MKMELRRARQDSPTENGWYYGRYSTSPDIVPYYVFFSHTEQAWCAVHGRELRRVTLMHWFGPVPTCIPATLPQEASNEQGNH